MEDPREYRIRALQTAVNLAREALAAREASDDPDDHELLDAYRADIEAAQGALDRIAGAQTVAVAGPAGVAALVDAMGLAGGNVVTGARRDRPYALQPLTDTLASRIQEAHWNPRNPGPRDTGEGEDTGGPSNRAARRKRERDARKAARVSKASKRAWNRSRKS